jgi:hypothetical protein
LADNLYYEAGVKIDLHQKRKMVFSGHVLNGWQRIQKIDGNQTPAFVHK